MSRALRFHTLAFLLAAANLPGLARARESDAEELLRSGIERVEKLEFERAIADFDEAVKLDPTNALAYQWRGQAWSKKSEHDKAIADFTEAIKLDPTNAWPYGARGEEWSKKKEYDKAVADCTEAIRLDPKDATSYRWRGYSWNEKKEYDKAIADCTEAIRLDPKDAVAYYNRGRSYYFKREYDKAIADFTGAIRLEPKDAYAYVSRGIAWHNGGNSYRAMADYDEAIRVDPKYASAHHNLALELMSQGLLDIAHPEFTTKGLFDKAAAEFKETVRLDPKDLEAHYYGGLCDWFGLHDGEAVSGMKDFLERAEWKGDRAVFATIIGHFAAIRSGKPDPARKFLDDFKAKGDMTAWPAPLVRYLRGEIDEKALLAASTDQGKLAASHGCLAIDFLLKEKFVESARHFSWTREHGNAGRLEFHISSVWLDRMRHAEEDDAKPKARPVPKLVAPDDQLPPVFD